MNLLLDFGADPNSRKEFSLSYDTPLSIACELNYFEIAKLLLDYGADPTTKVKNGLCCIHLAAKNGCLEICLLLAARGCDPNIRDEFGNTAGYWAKKNQFTELAEIFPAATVGPLENNLHKNLVEEHFLEITPEEKKKMKGKKGNK